MTNFEIGSIILSSIAVLISLPAFVISIIKTINEKKNLKKQFIIDNLIKLRENLNKKLTRLEELNPKVKMASIFKRIGEENFDYKSEAFSLYQETHIVVSDAVIILSSYKQTNCSKTTIKKMMDILEDAMRHIKIITKNDDIKSILREYLEYSEKSEKILSYDFKVEILIELSNTINHFIKDDVNEDEINNFFVQTKFPDENKVAFYAVKGS